MFGRRRNSPFQPLGLRLQRFGRRVMRNYAPSDTGPTRPASVPVPSSWQDSASEPLVWRSAEQPAAAPAPQAPQPEIMRSPEPQAAAPAPQPAPSPDTGGIGDEANNTGLLAILAAHERHRAPRPSASTGGQETVARKLAEATKSTAKPDEPKATVENTDPAPIIRGRRTRAAFDYVKTDALRSDMTPGEVESMQRLSSLKAPQPAEPAHTPAEEISEGSFTEIEDGGSLQRSADDNADVPTADSAGPTDMLFTPPTDDAEGVTPTLSPGIQRELDPNVQRMLDQAMTVTPSSAVSTEPDTAPAQPTIQREIAPRGTPSQPIQRETAPIPEPRTAQPTTGTPIQREVALQEDLDAASPFTPATRDSRVTGPTDQPTISRTADPAPRPDTAGTTQDGTSVPSGAVQQPTVQRELDPDVQRLLDQAMTVNPSSSSSAETPAAPTANTPIQRKADTSSGTTPVQRQPETTTPAAHAETPIQRSADSSTRPDTTTPATPSVSRSEDSLTFTPAPATAAQPVQRDLDPDVQRLLDQAMTVNPSSSVSAETPAAPTLPATPAVQRKADTSAPAGNTPIQRTTDSSAAISRPEAAPTETPIQRTADSSARPIIQRSPDTIAPATPSVSRSEDSLTFTPAPVSAAQPVQRELDPEVQRLLDQALTVNPSSSVPAEPPSAPTANTPIQRKADTSAPAASSTPIQRATDSAAPTQTPIQRTADSSTRLDIQRSTDTTAPATPSVSRSEDSITFTPAPTSAAQPVQRDLDPEVQRLLDQALTVNPSSSVPAEPPSAPTANTPIQRKADTSAPAANSTPIQRTSESSARPGIQRSPDTNTPATPSVSRSEDSLTFTPAPTSAAQPVQRDLDPEVQRLLDQALTVNPSSSVAAEPPSAPTANTPIQRKADTSATAANNTPIQRTTDSAAPTQTPIQRTADSSTRPAIQRSADTTTPATAPVSRSEDSITFTPAPTSSAQPVQRELDPEVQRLLDQAMTVNPSSSVPAEPPSAPTPNTPIQRKADTSAPAANNTPIQRTADTNRPTVQRSPETGTPALLAQSAPSSSAQPVQRELDPEVQRLLDQALTVNPSSSVPAEAPAASTASTPTVQRKAETAQPNTPIQRKADTSRPTIQRSETSPSSTAPVSRSEDSITFTPAPETAAQPVQRNLDPEVQRLLDQALTVNPSSSVPAEAPAASTTNMPTVQRKAETAQPNTPIQRKAETAQPNTPIQRSADASAPAAPVQRNLDPEVQRLLDQAMTVNPSSSTAPQSSAASTQPPSTPIQRTPATPAASTSAQPGVSPSIQHDPFNRTLSPEIQRRLAEAMRPSTPDISRSATPPVESRRPFIPSAPTAAENTPSTPTVPTAPQSVQRSPAPQTPATNASDSAATGPAITPASSGNLEADLLRWMGLPPDTPVTGQLSRKPDPNVTDLIRQAETSTVRSSEPPSVQREANPSAPSPAPQPVPQPQKPAVSQMPIEHMADTTSVQRAIEVDEMSTSVEPGSEIDIESTIETIAQRAMEMIRRRKLFERERNRKF